MPHFFIYGALMYSAIDNETAEAAYIPDHKIAFLINGIPILEPAFATLVPSNGEKAWGITVYYEKESWEQLTQHEVSYMEKDIIAHKKNGDTINCITFVSAKPLLPKEKAPSARYVRKLYTAAQHFQLPTAIIERYQEHTKKGNKWTLWINFIVPFHRRILIRFGKKPAMLISFLLMPICVIGIISLITAAIWFLLTQI